MTACVGALNSIFQINSEQSAPDVATSVNVFDDAENLFIFNAWVVKILNVH